MRSVRQGTVLMKKVCVKLSVLSAAKHANKFTKAYKVDGCLFVPLASTIIIFWTGNALKHVQMACSLIKLIILVINVLYNV